MSQSEESQVTLPQQAGLSATSRELVEEEVFRRTNAEVRHAIVMLLLTPFALLALLWICKAPLAQMLVIAESLLLMGMAARELSRRRESRRRFARALVTLNFLFAATLAWISGNVLIVMMQSFVTIGLYLLLANRLPSKRSVANAWKLSLIGFILFPLAAIWARGQLSGAQQAYRAGNWEACESFMNRAEPILRLRGMSPNAFALWEFRRAELTFRKGELAESRATFEKLFLFGEQLSGPPKSLVESGRIKEREVQDCLAWKFNNSVVSTFLATSYHGIRWGLTMNLEGDPLSHLMTGNWDDLGWCDVLVPEDARYVESASFFGFSFGE